MDAGLITPGKIDNRSITELTPDDVKGYERVHFFAGIAGWDYALNLAGWGEEPVWTGSCPCQPFSVAGKGKGTADERHLWPELFRLIRAARPNVVMGEQVAGKAGYGWLDGVRVDFKSESYACRGIDIPACGVNAPHIRQRLYWVADSAGERPIRQRLLLREEKTGWDSRQVLEIARGSAISRLGHPNYSRPQGRGFGPDQYANQRTPWTPSEFIPCLDGKTRRTQPGLFPLANGVPARMGKLRAYGNAIVPQVAAEVISAYMEAREMDRELLAA